MNLNEFIRAVKVRHLLDKYKIKEFYIFGSFARNEPARDIDILVDGNNSAEDLIKLKSELEELAGRPVDLIPKIYANPVILVRAKRDFVRVA